MQVQKGKVFQFVLVFYGFQVGQLVGGNFEYVLEVQNYREFMRLMNSRNIVRVILDLVFFFIKIKRFIIRSIFFRDWCVVLGWQQGEQGLYRSASFVGGVFYI